MLNEGSNGEFGLAPLVYDLVPYLAANWSYDPSRRSRSMGSNELRFLFRVVAGRSPGSALCVDLPALTDRIICIR